MRLGGTTFSRDGDCSWGVTHHGFGMEGYLFLQGVIGDYGVF